VKRAKEQAAATRANIVETAAREFRANGLQLSVADVMKAAGLTHGGFYRHFQTKDELIGQACGEAMRSVIDSLEDVARSKRKDGLRRLIERYLSFQHRDNCSQGCPIAALGSELRRSDATVRDMVVSEANHLVEQIAELLDPSLYKNRKDDAQFIFVTMVGAMTMSRLMISTAKSNEVLRNTTNQLISNYCR